MLIDRNANAATPWWPSFPSDAETGKGPTLIALHLHLCLRQELLPQAVDALVGRGALEPLGRRLERFGGWAGGLLTRRGHRVDRDAARGRAVAR